MAETITDFGEVRLSLKEYNEMRDKIRDLQEENDALNKERYMTTDENQTETNDGMSKQVDRQNDDISSEEHVGGDGKEAIDTIDMQSGTLKNKFDSIDDSIRTLENIAGAKVGNNSFDRLSDTDDAFAVFNYDTGNNGVFAPKVAPEEITVDDVDDIYKVKFPYGFSKIESIPVGKVGHENEWHLVTASELELNSADGSGTSNSNKIAAWLANDKKCVGIKLDAMYPLKDISCDKFPSSYKSHASVLPRDFFLVGTIVYKNGVKEICGGFKSQGAMIYTEHSLCLYGVTIGNELSYEGNHSIYLDVENGIDQLQVIDCKFWGNGMIDGTIGRKEGDNHNAIYPKGNYIHLHTPNFRTYLLKDGETGALALVDYTTTERQVAQDAYINHIYIKGCEAEGGNVISCGGSRIVKSCRIIKNRFYNICGIPIMFNCPNGPSNYTINGGSTKQADPDGKTFNESRMAMSCPIYIVGNTFEGTDRILKPRAGKFDYYGGIISEYRVTYALHNNMKNFMGGVCYNSGSSRDLEVYDAYLGCGQSYYCNNKAHNIVKFRTSGDGSCGICKAKQTNPNIYGGHYGMELCRYYKFNEYTLDVKTILEVWSDWFQSITKETDPALNQSLPDELLEYDHDVAVNAILLAKGPNSILSIKFANETVMNGRYFNGQKTVPTTLNYMIFSNNVLDAGDGSIYGGDETGVDYTSNSWCMGEIHVNDNLFKAKYFEHRNANHRDTTDGLEKYYLFRIRLLRLAPNYSETILEVQRNKFIFQDPYEVQNTYGIRFLSNGYYNESTSPKASSNPAFQSSSDGDILIVADNEVVNSSNGRVYMSKHRVDSVLAFSVIGTAQADNATNIKIAQDLFNNDAVVNLNETVNGIDVNDSKIIDLDNLPEGKTLNPQNPVLNQYYKETIDEQVVVKKCTNEGKRALICLYPKKKLVNYSSRLVLNKNTIFR